MKLLENERLTLDGRKILELHNLLIKYDSINCIYTVDHFNSKNNQNIEMTGIEVIGLNIEYLVII